jgi:phosphopantothenoylcysteine decarboxylase/phosphopantothenate--cysteine ligase
MSSKEIYGTKGHILQDKRILIGVTGSIAAIEVPHLVREILRYSGEPIVVLSDDALRFVTEDALTWSTGKMPYTEISGVSEHIRWSVDPDERVDLCIICPASANTIAKIANGIADTPVSLSALACIGAKIPCLVVPAAHSVLLDNPINERNIDYLEQIGVRFLSSDEIENKYKFPPLARLMHAIFSLIHPPRLLQGKKFLVTGGATREYLDDVRFLSNPSSGLSALYVVQALEELGASVSLVLGEGNNIDTEGSPYSTTVVKSTKDMYEEVKRQLSETNFDGFVAIAAVSDYRPTYQSGKIPSRQNQLVIDFHPTIKIVESIRQEFPSLFMVTYKAEVGLTEKQLIEEGTRFLEKNNVQVVCANWVGELDRGFMAETNDLFVIRKEKEILTLKGTKLNIGKELAKIITEELTRWTQKS